MPSVSFYIALSIATMTFCAILLNTVIGAFLFLLDPVTVRFLIAETIKLRLYNEYVHHDVKLEPVLVSPGELRGLTQRVKCALCGIHIVYISCFTLS